MNLLTIIFLAIMADVFYLVGDGSFAAAGTGLGIGLVLVLFWNVASFMTDKRYRGVR